NLLGLVNQGSRQKEVLSSQQPIIPLLTVERETIERAINVCEGNIPKAAALLEVSPSTIYRKKQSWESA
ncbi:MAG: helix-turn-helix domain-containing protein, partial [Cycloclasticus sp.]